MVYTEEHNNTLTVGEHDFMVTVTDNVSGCTSVEGPYTITVNPVPTDIQIASFPPGPVCEGTEAVFSVSNPESDLTYLWSTGEYGTSISASTAGEYYVRGISSFGCEGESDPLEIHRSPDTDLVPDGCHTHCAPDTICLPEIPDLVSYQWYLDDNPIPAPEGTVADYMPQESGSYNVELTSVYGCFAASDPFDLSLLPISADSLVLGACEGGSVIYEGEALLPGTTEDFYFENQWGCDSIVTVTVSEDVAYEFAETLTTCQGTTVVYNGVDYAVGTQIDLEYVTQFGCDSTIHLEVIGLPVHAMEETYSICTGTTFSYAGEALLPGTTTDFEFVNQYGCDSIVAVIVLEDLAYSETIELGACTGETINYEGVDYPAGTEETFSLTTVAGCDSIIQLSVAAWPTSDESVGLSTCVGSMIEYAGVLLSGGTDTVFQLVNQYGCDSVLQVSVEEVSAYEEEVALTACEGDLATYDGVDYPTGTDIELEYISTQGCDSTIFLTVSPLPVYEMEETYSTCTGTTFLYAGEALLPGTTTDFEFVNQYGCDSIVAVVVLEDLAHSETVELIGCAGETVFWEGVEYPTDSLYTVNLMTVADCDSVFVLEVGVFPSGDTLIQLEACQGSWVEYEGNLYEAGTTTASSILDQYGCYSVETISVAEIPAFAETVEMTGCEGETVTYNGIEYEVPSQTDIPLTNQWGCDSIIQLNIVALTVPIVQVTLEVCAGETVDYNGDSLAAGSVTEFILEAANGCDSIVLAEVVAYPEFDFAVSATEIQCWNASEGVIEVLDLTGGDGSFAFSLDEINYQEEATFTDLSAGDYTVHVQDGNGCVEEQEAVIDEISPISVVFDVPMLPCGHDSVLLQSQVLNGQTDSMTFVWGHGEEGAVIPVYDPGFYSVEITNTCETQTYEVEVLLEERPGGGYFYVPNAFSPNGDGVNDIFRAYAAGDMEVLIYELNLYDRWGNSLYRTTDVEEGWDGVFLEEAMNPGVYVWWLKAEVLVCGRRVVEVFDKGDVTILK